MPAEQLMRTTESIILSPTQISMILLKLHLVILLLWSGVCESDDHGWQNTQYKPVVRLLAIKVTFDVRRWCIFWQFDCFMQMQLLCRTVEYPWILHANIFVKFQVINEYAQTCNAINPEQYHNSCTICEYSSPTRTKPQEKLHTHCRKFDYKKYS